MVNRSWTWLLLGLSACAGARSGGFLTARTGASEEVRMAPLRDGGIGVVVVVDGELLGVDGLERTSGAQQGWLHRRDDQVDDPRLGAWRAAHTALRAVADSPDASAAAFADAAARVPFATLVGAAAVRFADEPVRAAALCDELGGAELGREPATAILRLALADPATDDARLARWLGGRVFDDLDDVAALVADCGAAGPRTAAFVLARLDDVAFRAQVAVLRALAPKLRGLPAAPELVVMAFDECVNRERRAAAESIVHDDGGWPELAVELLRRGDDLFFGDDHRAFVASVVDGPLFVGDVQREVVRAAVQDLYGTARDGLIARLRADPRLEAEARRLLERFVALELGAGTTLRYP